ncbi:unnamed protein product [Ceratitis capitata]|uniref:(Mediterranean fruit fly) hypothetical protein n=1 Tax=Ceratitis capitata TaxID=7213 RepID=A0A811V8Y1_CERCA|nr:unnamed protein product [Ceratitis capitata]
MSEPSKNKKGKTPKGEPMAMNVAKCQLNAQSLNLVKCNKNTPKQLGFTPHTHATAPTTINHFELMESVNNGVSNKSIKTIQNAN